ncbi:MAG: hypothetical protein J6U92_07435 [Clostridia bacterium]|nr:hypothetical protein [Clostridia bacterium]
MVTTRRSTTETTASAFGAGVGVLERPASYEEFVSPSQKGQCSSADEKLRRENLDRLLNYDRYAEAERTVVEDVATAVEETVAFVDEDIRPTSTTMQFGDDIDQIRQEMNQQKESEKVKRGLNGSGRLAITLYSLVITVILALIVLNTGVLAKLSNINQAKASELEATISRYSAIQEEIASISDSEYVMNVAQERYGMIKG